MMPRPEPEGVSIFAISSRVATIALVLFAMAITYAPLAQAQTYAVLANFFGSNGTNPLYVTLDAAGNIYGTTFYGGPYGTFGPGTVFKLTRRSSGWLLTTLYNFYGQHDGGNPWGGVTFGPDGSLYGTASGGGLQGHGVVYKLQPPTTICRTVFCPWTETVLYNFTGGADGEGPQGNLVFDRAGNIYGTTLAAQSGNFGALYELSPSQGHWNLTVIHTFTNSSDGGGPANGVIFDQAGNVYGTTETGGSHNLGVVYEFTPGTSGWTETVLHNFAGGSDGEDPAGLALDSHGNLYGFTEAGGGPGWGVAFELQPATDGFSYSIIYTFQPQPGGAPGFITVPILDSAGNVYGSGTSGGMHEAGVIFKLTPSTGSWNFTSLHDLTGRDGYEPGGGLAFDAQGNLYGCAENGGAGNFGVVWKITP
jgi:uncharacterized repeat protein (TIGR03803 family)